MRSAGRGDRGYSFGGGGGVEVVSEAPLLPPNPPPPGTHHLKLLVGIEAGLSSRSEVAENPERVPRTALVGVNPVFPCRRARPVSVQGQDPMGLPPAPPGRDLTIRQVRVVAV